MLSLHAWWHFMLASLSIKLRALQCCSIANMIRFYICMFVWWTLMHPASSYILHTHTVHADDDELCACMIVSCAFMRNELNKKRTISFRMWFLPFWDLVAWFLHQAFRAQQLLWRQPATTALSRWIRIRGGLLCQFRVILVGIKEALMQGLPKIIWPEHLH